MDAEKSVQVKEKHKGESNLEHARVGRDAFFHFISQMAQEMSPQKNEAQSQQKPRIKIMDEKRKSKPNYDRKAKHPDYVQFRCNVNAFNSIITDVKDKLNERQKKLLKKTPFWNLIELFYNQKIDMNNMNKSDLDLVKLLKKFDPDTKSFKFGTKSFQITANAVTDILGLPNEGKSVKLGNDRYTSTFRTRHFGEKSKPSKCVVEKELQKTIALANQSKKEKAKVKQKKKTNVGKGKKKAKEEEEEEGEDKEETEVVDYDKDVVSLILIMLCMTFLFANSSSTLHWKIVEHCVTLDTLSNFSWARAVSTYINDSLITKAKAKKGGKAFIGVVSGCTILILFLLCERTNIIQPILDKEKETPAILKWSLVELHTRFNQIKDLNNIEGIFKTPTKQKTLREEGDPVDKGILKTYKKRKTTREEGDLVDKKKENKDDKGGQGEVDEVAEQGKLDDDDQIPELKEIRKNKRFEIATGKEPVVIQDLLVKSMTAEINYRQHQDPSFVCPKRLKLWKDEINKDSEKKMMELWDIFIQTEKRSNELEKELATHKEKLHEECVAATMTVESTILLHEIQNLKRRITKLEGKEPHIEPETSAKKMKIQEKYKAEIEGMFSDPTIFEIERDLLTTQLTQPVEDKEEDREEEKKEETKRKRREEARCSNT
ncbi:unnamed protein product [Prunus armeniaca]